MRVDAGISGGNIGNKLLIWKHLTDWHFHITTISVQTGVMYPLSISPSLLTLVYTLVGYAELNSLLTKQPSRLLPVVTC